MRALYERNRNLTDPEEIDRALALGEFIRNGKLVGQQPAIYSHILQKRSVYTHCASTDT